MKKTLEFLYSLRNQGSKFGIERMELFCRELGNPQLSFPTIHVAGTNGKGSVCAMLDRIYRKHDYRVGLFTSPHLLELGERIRVAGENLSFSEIENWVEYLLPVVEKIKKYQEGLEPTFFEFMTAIAFLEFRKQKIDIAIFETGLGGRLDSTNVLNPEISVITSVGYDHCEILGNKLKEIAFEKAGIIKPEKPVVVGALEKEALDEVRRIVRQQNAELFFPEEIQSTSSPLTNLQGAFQQKNAALALRVVQLLKPQFPVNQSEVRLALHEVVFPGRWQKVSSQPTVILDTCHNGQGAQVSSELWDRLPSSFQVWFGACGQDRARDVLTPLLKKTTNITLFELDQPRSCTHQELRKITLNFTGTVKIAREKQISELCQQLDPRVTLLVTGSIYLVAAVLAHFKKVTNLSSTQNWQDHW